MKLYALTSSVFSDSSEASSIDEGVLSHTPGDTGAKSNDAYLILMRYVLSLIFCTAVLSLSLILFKVYQRNGLVLVLMAALFVLSIYCASLMLMMSPILWLKRKVQKRQRAKQTDTSPERQAAAV